MPRESIQSILTAPVAAGRAQRLSPDAALPVPVAAVFRELVGSVGADSFAPCDYPLVEQLAVALTHAREAARALERDGLIVDGKVNPIARLLREQQKLVAMLATRLRISPQSRMSREKAGANAKRGGESIAALYERARA
jgi:hypothetical protein